MVSILVWSVEEMGGDLGGGHLISFCILFDRLNSHPTPYVFYPFQITRHLSPYEQQIMMPWLKTFPKRVSDVVLINIY